jgi:hypothetical protein
MHHDRRYVLNTWNWIIGSMTLHDVERCIGEASVSNLR